MKVIKVIPVGEVPKRNNTLVIPDEGGHATAEQAGARKRAPHLVDEASLKAALLPLRSRLRGTS